MGAQASRQWQTRELSRDYVEIAADGTEIRPMPSNEHATLVHCTLGGSETDVPTYNVGIDEVWHFTSGTGLLWRKDRFSSESTIEEVTTGTTVTIPRDVEFQLRSTSPEPCCFICITTPPWPG